jgi:hypothetical protein
MLIKVKLTVIMLGVFVFCGTGRAELQILWQKQFGEPDISYSPGAAVLSNLNDYLIIMGTSYERPGFFQPKLRLWEIDANGSKLADIIVRDVPVDGSTIMLSSAIVRDMAVSQSGDIIKIGEFNEIEQSLIKVDARGRLILSKAIVEDSGQRGHPIIRMVSLADSTFILLGVHSTGKGLVMKYDSNCNKLWEKTYDFGKGKVNTFRNGAQAGNQGQFAVVGCSTDIDKDWSVSQQNIVVVLCDAGGKMIKQAIFPGSSLPNDVPTICRLNSGNFIVSYDGIINSRSSAFQLKCFDSSLTPLWEKGSISTTKLTDGWLVVKSIPVTDGGFVVAGTVNVSDLQVFEYDPNGNIVDSLTVKNVVRFPTIQVVCTADRAFIVMETSSQEEVTKAEIKVIAIRL